MTPKVGRREDDARVGAPVTRAAKGGYLDQIAIYGKGGIGKSVVATNLSAAYAMAGDRVLHVGCDPKVDSAIRLLDGKKLVTVMDLTGDGSSDVSLPAIVNRGRHGVDCIEAGGPEAGTGCAGRGVARTIEILGESGVLEQDTYDVAVFDVLGDVVCGGFASPLRLGFARKVVIVVSDQPMSWFAANNITRAIHRYSSNGVALAGLVANNLTDASNLEVIRRFAAALDTTVIASLPRDPEIPRAENRRHTVTESAPTSPAAVALAALAKELRALDPAAQPLPRTLSEDEFFAFVQEVR